MKLLPQRKSTLKKGLGYLLTILVALLLPMYVDLETNPYFHKIFCVLLLFGLFNSLRRIWKGNKQVVVGQQLRIQSQVDKLNLIFCFLFGIGIIVFSIKEIIDNAFLLDHFNYCLLGLIILLSGLENRKSVVLHSSDTAIRIKDSDFEIHPVDKHITFSDFQIGVTKPDGQIKQLKGLVIHQEEAKDIANWLSSKLYAAHIEYFWIDDYQTICIETQLK